MKKKGFTLIELMITIAVIGLLAAIALPRFAGVTEDAKVANVQGNLASLRTATQMYMAKNDGAEVHDMFDVYEDTVKPEFEEFYSKGKVPKIIAGKNLNYDKVGISYGTLPPNFDTVNDNNETGTAAVHAFFVDADIVKNTEGKADSAYFKEIYAYLQSNTYGADINWREF